MRSRHTVPAVGATAAVCFNQARLPSPKAQNELGMRRHAVAPSRGAAASEFCRVRWPSLNRGRREGRELAAPVARVRKKCTRRLPQVRPRRPDLPRAMVGRLLRDLLGDRLFCPHHLRRESADRLDASIGAPGPHDLTVRVGTIRLEAPPRPPHPRLACRDDRAQRPSSMRRDVREHRGDLPDEARSRGCDKVTRRAVSR
jgi:hypothetical protein